ncbi:DUF4432 family protein [Actinomyces sp. 2119]|uniref:DUF4432 family protein n=1 Tax=Actinomyces sp. 2119 TaxID=2321393 RepID=UPI000E6C2609|nr:DUF4432 family protein [Actinomyces sp. 2119]RJF43922.1 DUF4432 family protein [Actinomyces sp. 2119]
MNPSATTSANSPVNPSAATSTSLSARELLAAGLVAQPDAVAEVREEVRDPRSGPGSRALRVTTLGGVSVEVLPDRGLDLGSLWFNSIPVSWRSALGPRGGAVDPADEGWIGRFGGGLLVTSGVDHIGPPEQGHGLHGTHHLTPASDVAVRRLDDGSVEVSGAIDSSVVFGRHVLVKRKITVGVDRPRVEVRDTIRNTGPVPAAVPILYHSNLGAPLVLPGTRVEVPGSTRTPRTPEAERLGWQAFPEPTDEVIEGVWEHTGFAPGAVQAVVTAPEDAVRLTMSWDGAELPRCMQWVHPTRGGWVLGVEPASAPLFGPDRSGEHLGAPVLEPGQERASGVVYELS